jgi:hypothetical protein
VGGDAVAARQLGLPPQLGHAWFHLWRFRSLAASVSFGGGSSTYAYAPLVFLDGACIAASGGQSGALKRLSRPGHVDHAIV